MKLFIKLKFLSMTSIIEKSDLTACFKNIYCFVGASNQ